MKVADLQRHVEELRRLFAEAGAKEAVLAELAAVAEGLAPFRGYALRDFAGFLVRAEAYSRGEVPVVAPKGRRQPKLPVKEKEPPPDAGALGREAQRLYNDAASPGVTTEMVEALAGKLDKLKQKELLGVGSSLGLKFSASAPKKKIVADVRRLILDRKGSMQRADSIDRPTSPRSSPAVPSGGAPAEVSPGVPS